ncbi:MAG TPA: ABC transporter ATP-binding protein [Planctomycetota bacterium]|nr:ABC transporter ATP-binding protein [Planctomycetota bacterium]
MIRIEGLEKSFNRPVLNGITLAVPTGQVLGYLGANGAGKTTTIKILTGQLKPTAGTVTVGGHDVSREPARVKALIGYVPETLAVYEQLTPMEFLRFVGALHDLGDAEVTRTATKFLEFLDLARERDQRMSSFSKGMRKKVVLASALLHRPKVLFLDEPLDGLDANAVVQLKELIRRLAEDGVTVFYSSHVLDVVEKVCDRIVILKDGRIAADGTMEALRAGRAGMSLEEVFSSLTTTEDLKARARGFYDGLRSA